MAKTWLEQFTERVHAINATPGSGSTGDSQTDMANRILSMRDAYHAPSTSTRDNSSPTHTGFGGAWDNIKSGGGWLLDKAERPMEAIANTVDYTFNDRRLGQDAPGSEFGAFWKGFSGQEKTTYADVLEKLDPNGKDHALSNGILGFIGDVALDPLTYVGPGAVKAVFKGGTKLLGLTNKVEKLGKYARAQTPLTTVMDFATKAAHDLEVAGVAKVPTSNVEQVVKALDKPKKVAAVGDVAPAFRGETQHLAKKIHWDSLTAQAKEVTTAREIHSPKIPIEPIHKTTITPAVAATYEKAAAVAKSAKPVAEKVAKTPAEQIAKAGIPVAEALDSNAVRGVVKKYFKTIKGPNHKLEVHTNKSRAGKEPLKSITVKELDAVIHGGDLPSHAAGGEFNIPGYAYDKARYTSGDKKGQIKGLFKVAPGEEELVPIRDFARHIQAESRIVAAERKAAAAPAKTAEVAPEVIAKAADEAFVLEAGAAAQAAKIPPKELTAAIPEIVKHSRLKPSEQIAWRARHPHLSDAQAAKLLKAKGKEGFDKAVAELNAIPSVKDYADITKLKAAVIAGELTPKGMTDLGARLREMGYAGTGKGKTVTSQITQLEKKLSNAQGALNKASTTKLSPRAAADAKYVKQLDKAMADAALETPEAKALVAGVVNNGKPAYKNILTTTDEQETFVREALDSMHVRNFKEPRNKDLFPELTGTGVPSTSKIIYEGEARRGVSVHNYGQLDMAKVLMSKAGLMVTRAGFNSEKVVDGLVIAEHAGRPAAIYDAAMPLLNAAAEALRVNKIPVILGKEATGIPLSIHDILSIMPRESAEKLFFNKTTSLGMTQLAEIAEQYTKLSMNGLSKDAVKLAEMRASITKMLLDKKYIKLGSPVSKFIHSSGYANAKKLAAEYTDNIAAAFEGSADDMAIRAAENIKGQVMETATEVAELTDEVILKFDEFLASGASTSDILDKALTLHKEVNALAKSKGVVGLAVEMASDGVAANVASKISMDTAATAAKEAAGHAAATTLNESVRVSMEASASHAAEATSLMVRNGEDALDLGAKALYRMGVGMFRAFFPHLGNHELATILERGIGVHQTSATRFGAFLNSKNKLYTTEQYAHAFKLLQAGDEVLSPEALHLKAALQDIFAISDTKNGLLARSGITADAMHGKFAHFKIPDKYRMDPANMDGSWKTWKDIEDPLDFISKYHAAASSAIADRQIGAAISAEFGVKEGGPGLIKVVDTKGQSRLAKLIDTSMYYPEDIARQMHMMDRTLEELAKPRSNNPALRIIDSATHSYKAGLTIYNPAHHIRNMVGDMWLAHMDGVNLPYYRRAMAVAATRKHMYTDFDFARAMEDAFKTTGGKPPKYAMKLKFNGEDHYITHEEMYRMSYSSNVLKTYSTIEDIASGGVLAADKVASTLGKVSPLRLVGQGGQGRKIAGAASEMREHYVRIAHYMHALEKDTLETSFKGKKLSFEEALTRSSHRAGDRVNKWHPDGSNLTGFEKNVMRRSVLFYSWQRKAIPLAIEAAVMHPGRFMYYPKAMLNMAAANGIDLNGYGDAFPTDQLFPSYIRDSMSGPMWGRAGSYMGMKPGIPGLDLADDYANGPTTAGRAVAGGLSPLIKTPLEFITKQNLRTGAPIQDWTDYADSQIPFADKAAKLSGGRSPTSLFMQEQHKSPSNIGYDGNTSGIKVPGMGFKASSDLLNYLTGLSQTDYSKPSTIVSAQREQKVKR